MGDPKKPKKKFHRPPHPWQKARIEEEAPLIEEYGLKNKKELWKITSKVSHFKEQAKTLIARRGPQAEVEKQAFTNKLGKMGLLKEGAPMDDILDMSVKDLLERRLQTILMRKGLAKTAKQARQFIVHRHVVVKGQKMNIPSYLVAAGEEQTITFDERSNLADPEHPERKPKEQKPVTEVKEEKSEEETEEVVAE